MSSRRRKKLPDFETESHFVQMVQWLAMESKAEIQQMAERRQRMKLKDPEKGGETIVDLAITDHRSGLGGRTLVTFAKRKQSHAMPWHRLRVGSPVVVSRYRDDDGESEQGVVSKRTQDSLEVALSRWPDGDNFRIDLTADEVTRQRQLAAIMLAKDSRGRLGKLREILMGEKEPTFHPDPPKVQFQTSLNQSQQEAVRFALSANDLAIIHGPPGTGKTTTVVELIVQAVERGQQVLACAPSNTAVDNLLERLVAKGQKRRPHRTSGSRRRRPAAVTRSMDWWNSTRTCRLFTTCTVKQKLFSRKPANGLGNRPVRGEKSCVAG